MNKLSFGMGAFLTLYLFGNVYYFTKISNRNEEAIEQINAYVGETTTMSVIEEIKTERYVEYDVPTGDTSFKSYMDYKAITNTDSRQYKLQKYAETDEQGLRVYDGYYMIAVGSYYADNIGDLIRVTLDNGESFEAIVGDFKADRHTDSLHQYHPMEDNKKNVVEFIVETNKLSAMTRKMGDISYVNSKLKGNVAKIERIYKYE